MRGARSSELQTPKTGKHVKCSIEVCLLWAANPLLLQQVHSGTVSMCDKRDTAPAACTCWRRTAASSWFKPGANTAWTTAGGPCCRDGKTAPSTSFGTGRTTKWVLLSAQAGNEGSTAQRCSTRKLEMEKKSSYLEACGKICIHLFADLLKAP